MEPKHLSRRCNISPRCKPFVTGINAFYWHPMQHWRRYQQSDYATPGHEARYSGRTETLSKIHKTASSAAGNPITNKTPMFALMAYPLTKAVLIRIIGTKFLHPVIAPSCFRASGKLLWALLKTYAPHQRLWYHWDKSSHTAPSQHGITFVWQYAHWPWPSTQMICSARPHAGHCYDTMAWSSVFTAMLDAKCIGFAKLYLPRIT